MKWINVNSVEELKLLGTFKDVSNEIKNDLNPMIKINFRGWDETYNSIVEFRNTLKKCNKIIQYDSYFASKTDEYIYYLLELEGDMRIKKLGINKGHFSNKKKAKIWRDDILKIVNADKSNHPKADEAIYKLNSIYNSMIGKI